MPPIRPLPLLLSLLSLTGIGILLVMGPVAQDLAYHRFSDTRTLLGIPHALNTLSNLPFMLVGILGLRDLQQLSADRYLTGFRIAYGLLFAGTLLVGFGSAWYHLHPDNDSLVWDRLPMSLAFMALFSIIVAEFVSRSIGCRMLWPAVITGLGSVIYWAVSERLQHGDLRPYLLVQFLPMLLIPMILLTRRGSFSHVSGYWGLLACYLLAKAAELLDGEIHQWLGWISGHSLKHLLAAIGLLILAISYRQRRLNPAA